MSDTKNSAMAGYLAYMAARLTKIRQVLAVGTGYLPPSPEERYIQRLLNTLFNRS